MRDANTPLASFIDGFLVAKPLAPKSKRDYGRYLREFDVFTGHVSWGEAVTLDNAAQWVEEVRGRGAFAAHNACMYLKSLASWVAKSKQVVIPGGGSALAGLEPPKKPESRRQPFTDSQLERIWLALSERPNRDRARAMAYIRLLNGGGIRRNEGRQIAMRDLHIETDPARSSYIRVLAHTSKGQRERITRLDPEAVAALEAYINNARHAYWGPKNKPEPLFTTEEGYAFTENGFGTWCDRIFDDIEKATGIHGSSHMFRHTWATNYNRGMQYTGNNVYDLKREGGWRDLTIPLTYTHDRPEEELLLMKTPGAAMRERRPA